MTSQGQGSYPSPPASCLTSRHGLSLRQPRGTDHASMLDMARSRLFAVAGLEAKPSRNASTCFGSISATG